MTFISKALLVSFCSLALVACSNSPMPMYHYQLDEASDSKIKHINFAERNIVTLSRLEVPGYLKQSSLVLKQADQQLHFSTSHLWAEVPQLAIYNALLEDLNNQSDTLHFISWHNKHKVNQQMSVKVVIRHFYPTEGGDVVLSGYAELTNSEKNSVAMKEFYIQSDLKSDGFAHAVAVMRQQLTQMADEILQLTIQ
ncbi:MAG: membrane integrity-associated transporter subunit PqiC [Aestuariibacter sp.]